MSSQFVLSSDISSDLSVPATVPEHTPALWSSCEAFIPMRGVSDWSRALQEQKSAAKVLADGFSVCVVLPHVGMPDTVFPWLIECN